MAKKEKVNIVIYKGRKMDKRYLSRRIIYFRQNKTWGKKCQGINTYIARRNCTEDWKFISSLKTFGKEPAEWLNRCRNVPAENGNKYRENTPTQRMKIDGEELTVSVKR